MRKEKFVTGELYHIYNRGVDKRDVFLDNQDYFRGIHSIYTFNDSDSSLALARLLRGLTHDKYVQGRTLNILNMPKRNLLVEIISFCLMPNHYHLLIKQHQDNGVVKFMQKFGTAYTMYFNEKYKRSGALFQGKFKSISIKTESYLLTLLDYIHLNPVSITQSDWKKNGIKDWNSTLKFLEEYRWSSYQDYIKIKNFPSVINRTFIAEQFPHLKEYKYHVKQKSIKDFYSIQNLMLEKE